MAAVRGDPRDGGVRRLEWPRGWQGAAWAAVVYTGLTIAWTWPLATAMPRSLPWDMGDPVLNTWILRWTCEHLTALAAGHWSAWHEWWNPTFFHPAPLALAYSEHLVAQALLVLPVHLTTDNAILCYNVSLLSTYVLSALGAFLLARDLTGNTAAALLAGVLFGFTPYRIAQLSHLQVLSAQWMPFALYALRRHLQTGSRRSIVGFAASVVLQNLSCGYFLVYFFPFLALWIAGEVTARGRWRDRALLQRLAVAGAAIVALTTPFLMPYYRLRQIGFAARPLDEVRFYSADVTAYWTTYPTQWLWGSVLRASPGPENELFPGLVLIVLAGVAIALMVSGIITANRVPRSRGWRRRIAVVAGLAGLAAIVMTVQSLASGRRVWFSDIQRIRLSFVLTVLALAPVVLAAISASFRTAAVAALRRAETWLALGALSAVVFSFGPTIYSHRMPLIRRAPYLFCYLYVPGVDGLRVPARLAMIAVLFLSMLAACGIATIANRWRWAWIACVCLGILAVLEGLAAPVPLDRAIPVGRFVSPEGGLEPISAPPPVYTAVAALPGETVLIELPYGIVEWDLRAMYYTLAHRRPIINGYSGGMPDSYQVNVTALQDPLVHPDRTWNRLQSLPATHILVHEAAFPGREGLTITAWLRTQGAVEIGRFNRDVLLQLR